MILQKSLSVMDKSVKQDDEDIFGKYVAMELCAIENYILSVLPSGRYND